MLLTTTESLPGKHYEVLGIVKGGMVQSKHIGKDFMAGLKTIVGGEISEYTGMMEESRSIATERMIKGARQLGADAIICVRYSSASIMQSAAEIFAYGTAVKFIQ